jgi:hypothetical protein
MSVIIYETAYKPATDTRGTRILLKNRMTGKSKLIAFDHSAGGGIRAHEAAVREGAIGAKDGIVEHGGETKTGYLWVVWPGWEG